LTLFEAKLREKIADELTRLRSNLESRGTVQSFEDYQFLIGQIKAFERVIEAYFDEVNEDLSKEK
jgi:hypothetical protein